ncbi:hypothetical protein [Candidatus Spongiihabitans sp.]|uniref:hypothetical protein n=1 Tax=Candidatus Spongiihabitans sp. TaxID=3101308 RepID=UPI003C6EB12D
MSSAIGEISPDRTASEAVAKAIYAIHRDQADADGLEPLVDAGAGARNHSFDQSKIIELRWVVREFISWLTALTTAHNAMATAR